MVELAKSRDYITDGLINLVGNQLSADLLGLIKIVII